MTSLDDALAAIWERSRPIIAERLTRIEVAAAAAATGAARDDDAHREGVRAAHQLAGSLGTFGLHEGSDLARAIEHELEGAADAGRLGQLTRRLRDLLDPRLA